MTTNTLIKTLPKRHTTKQKGVYYKEIQKTTIDGKGKIKTSIIDKVYSIQYKDIDDKWKFKTLGKFSEGVRESFCKIQRDMILNKVKFGEQPPIIKKKIKKEVVTVHDVFKLYISSKLSFLSPKALNICSAKVKLNLPRFSLFAMFNLFSSTPNLFHSLFFY